MPPVTRSRSRRRKLLGKQSPDIELLEEEENVPVRTGRKLILPRRKTVSTKEFFKLREQVVSKSMESVRWEPSEPAYLTPEQLAEFALDEYNKKHGTDIEYLRLPHVKVQTSYNLGYSVDFVDSREQWTHLNFEARRHNADPRDKPLLLFAEVYLTEEKYHLTTLSLVKPEDEYKWSGCQCCRSNIIHPHRFRAGFGSSEAASEPEMLSIGEATELSQKALTDYNDQNGTNLKFICVQQCNRFTCVGLLMDFTVKNTSWVHLNFEAKVGLKDEVLCLFGELYLGDDGNYVLATLSATEPSHISPRLREKMKLDFGCPYCPDDIFHPWCGFRFCYNYEPCPLNRGTPPTSVKVAACD